MSLVQQVHLAILVPPFAFLVLLVLGLVFFRHRARLVHQGRMQQLARRVNSVHQEHIQELALARVMAVKLEAFQARGHPIAPIVLDYCPGRHHASGRLVRGILALFSHLY